MYFMSIIFNWLFCLFHSPFVTALFALYMSSNSRREISLNANSGISYAIVFRSGDIFDHSVVVRVVASHVTSDVSICLYRRKRSLENILLS